MQNHYHKITDANNRLLKETHTTKTLKIDRFRVKKRAKPPLVVLYCNFYKFQSSYQTTKTWYMKTAQNASSKFVFCVRRNFIFDGRPLESVRHNRRWIPLHSRCLLYREHGRDGSRQFALGTRPHFKRVPRQLYAILQEERHEAL